MVSSRTLPWSATACSVAPGMVLTVNEAAKAAEILGSKTFRSTVPGYDRDEGAGDRKMHHIAIEAVWNTNA
jgi:hypothetical protein